jgi:hypothetical protein
MASFCSIFLSPPDLPVGMIASRAVGTSHDAGPFHSVVPSHPVAKSYLVVPYNPAVPSHMLPH